MTDKTLDKELEKEELATIKTQLNMMGIKFHHNANLYTLRELLTANLVNDSSNKERTALTETSGEAKRKAMEMVRCSIVCHDPQRKARQGEYFTTGNSVIGTFRAFVPYNEESDIIWHLPRMIIDILKRKRCIKAIKQVDGKNKLNTSMDDIRRGNAFTIVELPPLTVEELKELAENQRSQGYNNTNPNEY